MLLNLSKSNFHYMSQPQSNDIYQAPESFSPERADETIVKSLVKRHTQMAVINELRLKGKDAYEAKQLVKAALPEAKKRMAKRNLIYHILFFVGLFEASATRHTSTFLTRGPISQVCPCFSRYGLGIPKGNLLLIG